MALSSSSALPDGSYPEPTTREMFALGSKRIELAEAYFTADAVACADSLRALVGAEPVPTTSLPACFAGPLLVDIRLPLSEASVEAAAGA